jgi:hypothetical protein
VVRFTGGALQWSDKKKIEVSERLREGKLILDEDTTPTLSDSGTNIDIISEDTARWLQEELGLEYLPPDRNSNQYVTFGKRSARSKIVGYMWGKGLLGKVAVVEDVAANLISVRSLCQRGMKVEYDKEQVIVRSEETGEVLFTGRFDGDLQLYTMDIVHLMMSQGTKEGHREGEMSRAEWCAAADGGRDFRLRRKKRFKERAVRKALDLHRNMRHIPFSTMANNIEMGTWASMDSEITPALLRELADKRSCVVCATNRWNEVKGIGSGTRVYTVGEAFAFDYQGPIRPTARSGETGEFIFYDLGSGYTQRYGEKSNKVKVIEAVRAWCAMMLSNGHTPLYGRSDSGSVETGQEFAKAMAELNIQCIPTPPGQPEINVERRVQTQKTDVATILSSSPTLKASDWDIASEHACLLRSTMMCVPSRLVGEGDKSPYELVMRHKPRVDVFQEFGLGDIGVVKKPEARRPRYGQSKNEVVQIVGIEVNDTKALKVEFVGRRTRARRGRVQRVNLLATAPGMQEQRDRVATYEIQEDGSTLYIIEGGTDIEVTSLQQIALQEMRLAEERESEEVQSIGDRIRLVREERDEDEEIPQRYEGIGEGVSDQDKQQPSIEEQMDTSAGTDFMEETIDDTEERRQSWFPKYWEEESEQEEDSTAEGMEAFWTSCIEREGIPPEHYVKEIYDLACTTAVAFDMTQETDDEEEAKREGQEIGVGYAAKKGPRTEKNPSKGMIRKDSELAEIWKESMTTERKGIIEATHRVSEEEAKRVGVTPHVTDRSTKRDGRRKTRVAIDGSFELRQQVFPDRDMLYSPAMDDELLRVTLQYAVQYNMDLGKSDVVQCFTQNDMATARFPRRIIIYLDEYESGTPGGDYRQFDSVSYGTADASSEWYINLKRGMQASGFRTSILHPCLFMRGSFEARDLLLVAAATDDLLRLNLPTDEAREGMKRFKRDISNKWPMIHTDDIDEILGVRITRDRVKGHIECTQPDQLKKIEGTFFDGGRIPRVLVPLHPSIESSCREAEECPDDIMNKPTNESSYRSKLGKLQYIRVTRLDVLFALSVLAERSHCPTVRDLMGLFWLAAYLLTTRDVPLSFHITQHDKGEVDAMIWSLFSDCSWGTRRNSYSSLGHIVVCGNLAEEEARRYRPITAPVVAKTKKEKGPPSDSASAGELKSTVEVIKSGMAIRGMTAEIEGIAREKSLERVPEGPGRASPIAVSTTTPLLTDNASNVRALATTTFKKPKGLRQWSRELHFAKFHIEEESIHVVAVPAQQQRANPLTKAIRSPSMHWKESEWLLGTSRQLEAMQETARGDGERKKGFREEVEEIKQLLTVGNEDNGGLAYQTLGTVVEDVLLMNTLRNAEETAATERVRATVRREREETTSMRKAGKKYRRRIGKKRKGRTWEREETMNFSFLM